MLTEFGLLERVFGMTESSKRWKRVKALFEQAMDVSSRNRFKFISDLTDSDDIKREVMSLVESASQTGKSFESLVSQASAETYADALTGSHINNYKIVKLLGRGGMGDVYLAERADQQYTQSVALKLVSGFRPSEESIQRFRHERQILASLNHPNISGLLDGGETADGSPYLVMEYVDGIQITEYCDNHNLTTHQRIKLFIQVCEAVQYAHRNLIVHRDIKASNILVEKNGRAKLLDFGIAKVLEAQDPSFTRSATRMLSPLHASPEQVQGKNITVSSDIYSLGVLLYQLMTGLHPIEGKHTTTAIKIEKAICEIEPTKPSQRLSKHSSEQIDVSQISRARATAHQTLFNQIRGDIDNIAMKALNKEPERRYQTVQSLIDDLQRFLQNRPVLARPQSMAYRFKKYVQRNSINVAVATLATVAIGSMAIWSYASVINERDTARTAQQSAEAISEFLQDVFTSVDPSIAKGETITALELLKSGQERLTQSLNDEPALKYAMHLVFAETFYSLEERDEAIAQAQEAINLIETYEIDDIEALASAKLTLGLISQDTGDYIEAEKLLDESRALIESIYKPPHRRLVELIHSQAFLQDTLSHHDKAIDLYQQAINMNNSLPSDESFEPGWTETRLSDVYRKEGQYEKGIEVLQSVIPQMDTAYGGLHPKLAVAKRQLAMLLKDTLKYEESEALYLEILAEQQQLYDTPSTELGITYSEYSLLLREQDRDKEALDAATKNMRILDAVYQGKPNGLYAAAYNNHGYFLRDIGEFEQSIVSFEKSIEQQNLMGLPEGHFHRSFPLHGKALTHIELSQYADAEEILRQVLPMRLEHMDESHLYVTQVKSSLGDALMRQGKLDEAEEYLLDSLKFYSQYQGEESKQVKVVRGFLEELQEMRNALP